MRLWICEKRDPGQGYIDTDDGRVTWARGHLLEQVAPPGYDKAWEAWNFDVLPMIPSTWKHQPTADKQRELAVLLANIPEATEIVIATDCGAEAKQSPVSYWTMPAIAERCAGCGTPRSMRQASPRRSPICGQGKVASRCIGQARHARAPTGSWA
ncbi:toprim domain-containing protein [Xanthomonas campestris]|uniref:toprim domain-containing protein n=1 Tax=Xanthomonas campestris TaxID=339 RepID=UPI001F27615C|nr:toprim domain-containing protein [Xanthomonas campestris]